MYESVCENVGVSGNMTVSVCDCVCLRGYVHVSVVGRMWVCRCECVCASCVFECVRVRECV